MGIEGTNPAPESTESDLSSILLGTSGSDTTGSAGDLSGEGASGKFKFSGREFPDQSAAEKWANQTYGKLSESQGVLKMVKQALQDPELLRSLSQDERWAPILAKFGIEAAEEDIESEEEAEGEDLEQQDPESRLQALDHQYQVRMDKLDLKEEMRDLQEELGRKISDDEWNTTMRYIQRHSSLSAKDAYFLANRQKLMLDAQKKAEQAASQKAPKSRPRPLPQGVPGTHLDLKKKVEDMSDAEFREFIKTTPDFQALISRE